MAKSAALELGRVVWAEVADANGIRKLRPGIIITATNEIDGDRPLRIVAVTSRLPDPIPEGHVLLPWHPLGHVRTRLNRKCAAVCNWICEIMPSDIRDVAGVVPGECLLDILTRIERGTGMN
jgi:hypothetical protein